MANPEVTKTSRILAVYHLFRRCQEVSFQELRQQLGVSERTSLRDIRLLERAGVLEVRYDRGSRSFLPLRLEPGAMAEETNRTRKKYLEKLRRLCVLMARMEEEEPEGMNRTALYREILPGVPDRTRQRDFQELEKLGYAAWYEKGWDGEPGQWRYEIPGAYEIPFFPKMAPLV